MEWYLVLLVLFGSFIVLMFLGLPIAFAFLAINIIGMFIWFGGDMGLRHLISSIVAGISRFSLLPVALFILMGEVMHVSGLGVQMLDALDKWLGRIPGRLGLLAVAAGTVFSTFTGVSVATIAILGTALVPEMERRGYKKSMSLGPILGSGGLAVMIPPSPLAVVLAVIGEFSTGEMLIGIILPGLLMASLYALYIIIRCQLQPSIAPAYTVTPPPMLEKLSATARYILPLAFIIFTVVGLIFLGVATPSEAAAAGALSTFILAAFYKRLNWEMVAKSVSSAMLVTGMIFMIILGAVSFSEVLAFSGASSGMIKFIMSLPVSPILLIILMQVVVVILGMFITPMAIIMITIPIFMPAIHAFGFDPVWFSVLVLISIEVGVTSPPFGTGLFFMKGVAPPDTTMSDIWRAGLPFIYCDLIAIGIVIALPIITLWLPSIMTR